MVAPGGSGWLRVAPGGSGWFRVALEPLGCSGGSGWRWVAQGCSGWLVSGSGWLQVAQGGSGGSGWLLSGSGWLRVIPGWLRVALCGSQMAPDSKAGVLRASLCGGSPWVVGPATLFILWCFVVHCVWGLGLSFCDSNMLLFVLNT